ncbi:hypothetical protein GCM10008097_15580 [Mycetocola manganoxydans]|nr:hypothetical protein GCM10008097_15580 [Mycetocola manganoxydans]
MVRRQLKLVVESFARHHGHERIVAVALGRHMKAVHVQVCWVFKTVVKCDAKPVSRLQPERWSWNPPVKAQGVGGAPADLNRAWGRVQAELQPAVRAAQF